jgi:ABC-type transport system involved in multi-copper enzyme maturation permease subunit
MSYTVVILSILSVEFYELFVVVLFFLIFEHKSIVVSSYLRSNTKVLPYGIFPILVYE